MAERRETSEVGYNEGMFNAKESLKWSEEVKGSKRRGKLRIQKTSSRIKRKTQKPRRRQKILLLWKPKEREKKNLKSVGKRTMAKIGKNMRINQQNQDKMTKKK